MNNTVLIDVMRDTAKVRAELREARQAFDTLVRHIEVLHYNFVQNRGGKLGPPARPPDRPCDARLQRVVGLISELLVVVRGAPREKPNEWVTAGESMTSSANDLVRRPPATVKITCPVCRGECGYDHNSYWCDKCKRLWPPDYGNWGLKAVQSEVEHNDRDYDSVRAENDTLKATVEQQRQEIERLKAMLTKLGYDFDDADIQE